MSDTQPPRTVAHLIRRAKATIERIERHRRAMQDVAVLAANNTNDQRRKEVTR